MLTSQELKVIYKQPESLHDYPGNARTHTKAQIQKIASSIRAFGFTNPILIDQTATIIAGHGRVKAAKLVGMDRIPTILLESLSPDEVRAYVIADNRLAEDAGWDKEILKIELQHLTFNTDIELELTGFEVGEIDLLLEDPADPDGDLPTYPNEPVSRLGDLWQLGDHRILCGDSRNEDNLALLMNGQQAAVRFTDPPYNVPIDGHVSGNGIVKHGDFAMASGEMSRQEFEAFLETSLGSAARHSLPGAIHFVCMDWRHLAEILSVGGRVYSSFLNLCVWVKDNGGMGSFYRSQHELVCVFRNGDAMHRNNIQLGRFGRYRTNVWDYPAIRALSQQQDDEGNLLRLHPTVKPVALIADALLDCSKRGDIVLDPLLGSGSTLLAAERVGRVCRGIEIDPTYVDVAIRCWQKHTGEAAVHALTGVPFVEAESQVQHA